VPTVIMDPSKVPSLSALTEISFICISLELGNR
jgi:hypothetical protein